MDPLKLDAKLATPAKEIGYASIGLALYTRGGNNSHRHGHGRTGYGKKTDEEMDEETERRRMKKWTRRRTTYEIQVHSLQIRKSYNRNCRKRKQAQSGKR
ncbi:hypothetical protein BDD12DRAFT_894396 [Trichophaea hybrida]|nr:hypothetical protein BDD12DRAFT_894396 [Trichophaea hybrida]